MVDLRDIIKRWGSVTAVDGVSLVVPPGEFLTLLGPSGCGKTTLLRMIGGFEIPTSGSVSLDGQDVTELPPYRRNVNQVFQSYALFPHLDVFDNIAFGLRLKKVPRPSIREQVDRVLELTSLLGFERRMPNQLSGGQRQRVALARAIVNEPKVLLLDEPLGALDARLRHSMQLELKRLQRRLGITFIFVTHDQDEAMTMSDRIAVMSQGKIVQIGGPAEIYHRPATAFVAQFIGQTNLLRGQLSTEESASKTVELEGGLKISVNDAEVADAKGEVLLSLRPERLKISQTLSNRAGGCAIEAVVVEHVFKGAVQQVLLRTAGGTDLVAQTSGDASPSDALPAGHRVFCTFDPADVWPVKG